jgi:hypothetical protein
MYMAYTFLDNDKIYMSKMQSEESGYDLDWKLLFQVRCSTFEQRAEDAEEKNPMNSCRKRSPGERTMLKVVG